MVEQGAPKAPWRVGHHRIKSYMWQNHPVLAHDNEEVPLADLVPGLARGQASGRHPSDDEKLARIAAAVIQQLNDTEEAVVEEEPFVEVEDLGEDELRGRELEVFLREDIAPEHSRQVDRLVRTLVKEEGISGAVREDREVLLVTTPRWSAEQLHQWVTRYIEDKIYSSKRR